MDASALQVPGYEGGPFSHHPEFFEDHLFWISHLGMFIDSHEIGALLLGPDDDASREFLQRVFAQEDWPLFVIPLGDGGRVYIVYRTLEDDVGIDVLAWHPDDPQAELVASSESSASPTAPKLSWAELAGAAHNGPPGGSTSDPAERLLLLFPALETGDHPAGAEAAVAAALSASTAVDDPDALAALLVASRRE